MRTTAKEERGMEEKYSREERTSEGTRSEGSGEAAAPNMRARGGRGTTNQRRARLGRETCSCATETREGPKSSAFYRGISVSDPQILSKANVCSFDVIDFICVCSTGIWLRLGMVNDADDPATSAKV